MMKTIQLILFFTALLLVSCDANAQNKVSYGYDDAGNRISRIIVMEEPVLSAAETEGEATVYSEVLAKLQIKIYPNPTQGLLRIEIDNLPPNVSARIALYQLSGKLVTLQQNVTHSTEMNITGQPAGIYLLKIIAGEEQTEWKIIKK
jgi:uncharacterized protein YcfL